MLFFTPNHEFFLEKLSDNNSHVWFRKEVVYCETELEFLDLRHVCPGMTLSQKVKYLSTRCVKVIDIKDIKDLIRCLLFHGLVK